MLSRSTRRSPEAVATTRENAAINHVSEIKLEAHHARISGAFDLCTAISGDVLALALASDSRSSPASSSQAPSTSRRRR